MKHLEFLKQGFLFRDFWGQKVQQLNSRWHSATQIAPLRVELVPGKGKLELTLVPVFLGILTKQAFLQWKNPPPTSHQGNWSEVLSPISYIHEFFVVMSVTITHGYEGTGATTLLQRWVGSGHFELVVWLQSHHYKYNPLRMGIQGFKTLDLFVLLSKKARKNYKCF